MVPSAATFMQEYRALPGHRLLLWFSDLTRNNASRKPHSSESMALVSILSDCFVILQATNKVLAATGCIVGGCLLLVVYGNHMSDTLTVADMIQYYDR